MIDEWERQRRQMVAIGNAAFLVLAVQTAASWVCIAVGAELAAGLLFLGGFALTVVMVPFLIEAALDTFSDQREDPRE